MKDFMIVPTKIISVKEDIENNCAYVESIDSFYENIDLGFDRVKIGCFTDDLRENGNERPCLLMHDSRELPVGLNTYTDSLKGLMCITKMPLDDDLVKGRLLPQLKVGSIKGRSIGYEPLDYEFTTEDNMRIRNLKKCKLYESSFVNFPMNPKCQVLSLRKFLENSDNVEFKSFGKQELSFIKKLAENLETGFDQNYKDYPVIDVEWDKSKSIKQIKNNTDSNDAPGQNYKNGFMWYDKENENQFTAYKMPFVYFDGEFKAVFKALAAIIGAISGSKCGIKISEDDKEKIKNQINKYYKKLDKEIPFKEDGKCFVDIETIKCFEKRDLIKIFDSDLILSNNAKSYIVENLKHLGIDESDSGDNDIMQKFRDLEKTAIKL